MAIGTALVTGASAGIGEVFARKLAQRNWDLVLVARRQERLEAISTALAESYGVRCEHMAADLSAPGAADDLFARLSERELHIDYLVNNAGVGLSGAFAEQDFERISSMMRLNMDSLTRLTYLALPHMLGRKRGVILNVASMGSFQAVPYFSVYAGTKAYVLHFTEGLAEELRGTGVTVAALCPGATTTEFNDVAGFDTNFARMAYDSPEAVVDAALAGVDSRQTVILPTLFTQVHYGMSRVTPRQILRRVVGSIFRRASLPQH